ncbi:MAG TPA: hypothetical protein VFY94_01185, partial [Rhodanobacteraceae bacterium]|nr:hypothetical protein [Rhodanobacteraceae bacterium]
MLPVSAAINDNSTCTPARTTLARPMMGANSRSRSKRRHRGRRAGAAGAADPGHASVEQSAERIDGIARVAATPQLVATLADDPPLETSPSGLTRGVGLIGFEQTVCLARPEPGQQPVGMITGLGGHEHRADQTQ